MSVKLVTGEPAAGKSLYVMRELMSVITRTNSPIVTNMPIKLDPWMFGDKPMMGLRAYLDSQYDDTYDIDTRLRIIPDEESAEFYSHRGFGLDVDVVRDAKGNPEELDIQKASEGQGVVYVVDECWKFFGARDWQTTGKALTFYAKQHRKLGDDVWLCTHDFKDVDTAIRRVVEQTIVMRNHARMRIGLFRQPKYFTAEHYAKIPSGQGQPMHTDRFTLDADGLCQCYDTSAGVGIAGGVAADTKTKPKGLHFGYLIALVVVIAIACTQFPYLLGKVIGKATLSGAKAANAKVIGTNSLVRTNHELIVPVQSAPVEYAPLHERKVAPAEFSNPVRPLLESQNVALTGMYRNPLTGEVKINLSDGSTYSATDREVQLVTEKYIVIQGMVYRWPKLGDKVTQRNPQTVNNYQPSSVLVDTEPRQHRANVNWLGRTASPF